MRTRSDTPLAASLGPADGTAAPVAYPSLLQLQQRSVVACVVLSHWSSCFR